MTAAWRACWNCRRPAGCGATACASTARSTRSSSPACSDGIAVDGVFYGAIEATLDREQGSNAWLTIGLREGKNREVKNILGALGLDVTRLIRISFGPFQLGDLPEGHVQEIKGRMLRDQLGERLIEESGADFEAADRQRLLQRAGRARAGAAGRGSAERAEARARRRSPADRRGRPDQEPQAPRKQPRRGARQALDAARQAEVRARRAPERPKLERGERPDARRSSATGRPQRDFAQAGAKPRGGKKPEREQRPIEPPGRRKANVWMAPGARPIGTGRAAAEKAEVGSQAGRQEAATASRAASRPSASRAATSPVATGQRRRRPAQGPRKRRSRMRIVGGEFRGRPLATPRTQSIRPTTDRTREALFNVLAHRFADKLAGARVLDLFAGTGALGLEALSRGAAYCLFVEESAEGRGLIRTNVEAFGLHGAHQDLPARRDAAWASRHGAAVRLVFADPPYGKGLGEAALRSALTAAGCCPARCAWSRRRRRRPSRRATASPSSTSAPMARR